MEPSIDAWLTRFAAGAGTLFEWQLQAPQLGPGEICTPFLIRAAIDDGIAMCPLSAEASLEYGEVLRACHHYGAAQRQHIDPVERCAIALAADGDVQASPEIRTRLLRICRLEEPPYDP